MAAIADYEASSVVRGKIASGRGSLTLSLRPAPKVLPVLRRSAPGATLVSFKLEAGLDDDALEQVARQRLEEGVEDLVVANDIDRISRERHPALVVPADGDPVPVDGTKTDLAVAVLDAVEASRA